MLGVFSGVSSAQNFKKVLGRPYVFEKPLALDKYHLVNTSKKENGIPWVVICDRSDQTLRQTYADPGSDVAVKEVAYKDYYYVADEKGEWIRIIKAHIDGIKVKGNATDYGWIHKSNMLLWSSGLLSAKTEINLKAFLLNKKTEIEKIIRMKKKEIVPIFSGPITGERVGQKTIHEFYFVLKKGDGEKGENRYLLAKDARLAPNDQTEWQTSIIGWVEEERLTEWDTRICLEPNFQKEAFEERKNNLEYRLRAYSDRTAAKDQATTGKVDESKVEWDNDPVKLAPNQLATKDPMRFKGGVVRFPMIDNSDYFFSTGVIGEIHVGDGTIGEIPYSGIVDEITSNSMSKKNYNVFFLIEGSESMKEYQEPIVETIKTIRKEMVEKDINAQFGAAIYRDGLEKEKDKIFQLQPLTSQINEVVNFVENSEFRNWYDNDNYTCLHYGLSESIKNAGFNDAYTNIIYIIGNYGDYSSHVIRKRKAEKENDPTLIVNTTQIVQQLSDLNINLIGVQGKRDDGKRSGTFTDQCQDLMLESAKLQYNDYKDATTYINDLKLLTSDNIKFSEANGEGIASLEGAAVKAYLAQPEEGEIASASEVSERIEETGTEVTKFVGGFWKEMSRIVDEGAPIDNVSSGPFAPAAAKQIMDLINSSDAGFSKEDVQKIAKNKYKLYAEAYIPKEIPGAKYRPYSFVLFMPDTDLESYLAKIDQITYALNGSSRDELRLEIYDMFIGLLKFYTGNDNQKELSKKGTDEVRRVMQGLEKEGLELQNKDDFIIGDVLHKRKMSDEEVGVFTNRLLENSRKLSRIKKKGKDYEFSYTSGGVTYFWVPIEWTF